MRCVGYRQAWDFLEKIQNTTVFTHYNNEENFHEYMTRSLLNTHSSPIEDYRQTMQNEALYATRQLAKRQYTWMRRLVSTQQLVERFDITPLTTIDEARTLLIKTS